MKHWKLRVDTGSRLHLLRDYTFYEKGLDQHLLIMAFLSKNFKQRQIWNWTDFYCSSFLLQWTDALSATFQNAPPSSLLHTPLCLLNCGQHGPALLQARQEARDVEMRSNRFGFRSSRKPTATPHPICVPVRRREWRARCLALFLPRIFQTVNLILPDKNRCRNQHLPDQLRRWIPVGQSADWLFVESAEARADSVAVISGAVGSSMMRFHTTLEAAEGQCYDALQQGVPQQPKVTLLLYLPSSWHMPLVWQSLLATPLCRCQEGQNGSLSLHFRS